MSWQDWATLGGGVGGVFTALAAIVAAWQLRQMQLQSTVSFEDALVREYRELASTLPLPALLGDPISDELYAEKLDEFYRYFDLCNSQVFLHERGRISDETWAFWEQGIRSNLKRPIFAHAWAEIAARANGDFSELRRICPPAQPVVSGAAA
ncbi:hypothetical protein ABL850_22880 [Variovorax paradoxus]|jgi:hypothetical protein|uniref:hypothetical protein n=1 Tax=Variovorax paradoxus TaxID=34073 RepID=UPI00040FE06C